MLPWMFAIVAHRRHGTNGQLAERGDAVVLPPRAAVELLQAGDLALGRLDVLTSLEGIQPGMSSLRRLREAGVHVLNDADALRAMHDKLITALRLHGADVPQPRTGYLPPDGDGRNLTLPAVVKPRYGSWGHHVYRCTTRRGLRHALRLLRQQRWFMQQGAIVQELVPPRGHDLRVLVAGGEVVGAVRRKASPGEWRTNIALGGTREPALPDPAARRLALRAASVVRADLVGVDLLPLGLGWTVLELNGAVDFTAQYSFGEEDVFERAMRALRGSVVTVEAA
jgi:[lysine-biosynthesis-protein LysW]--L-2-aminoadipate ligase